MPAKLGYRAIADHIAARIDTGHIRPGDQLPARRDICAEWGVSDTTANRVHRELEQRGYALLTRGQRPTAVDPRKTPPPATATMITVVMQLPASTVAAVAARAEQDRTGFDTAVAALLGAAVGA